MICFVGVPPDPNRFLCHKSFLENFKGERLKRISLKQRRHFLILFFEEQPHQQVISSNMFS